MIPIRTCAIIPARGGSKALPRKNVLPLAGVPLLAHTISAAKNAELVDLVVVSTDDEEIAHVAREYGAEVVMRPAELATDEASSESALLHALDTLEERIGNAPEILVFLQCTSPLTAPEDIDGTLQKLYDDNADTALAVTDFHYFVWKDHEGEAVGINHDKRVRLRRQDRDPQYVETGAVYVMRTAGFREAKHRFFGRTAMHEIPNERVLEIDDPTDFEVAEALLVKHQQTARHESLPSRIEALILDFDGVFTDNKVIVFQDGDEAVVCDRGDGMGLAQLKRHGLPLWVLSTEQHPVLKARCEKLGIPCMHDVQDKYSRLVEWLSERKIDSEHVVYVGNDINDIDCLRYVGCGVVVADAHPGALAAADLVLNNRGGQGAIRELTDLILEKLTQLTNA